ncbi:MAG: VCBS repeat-containing protein [Deltaproteobacteria bacterium]|nr:VCBS repeat-containing protein [Deltaproteobacteria bacterium]
MSKWRNQIFWLVLLGTMAYLTLGAFMTNGAWAQSPPIIWNPVQVDGANTGLDTSIARDAANNVHISYYDVTNGDLKYANNKSGAFVAVTVDGGGAGGPNVGEFSSIALDNLGNVHISYYDATNGALNYATNASGAFVVFPAIDGGIGGGLDAGQDTSIFVDANGTVHISYYDVANGDLKYAFGGPAGFTTVVVDDGGIADDNVGQYTSIAVVGDVVHISYHDVTNGALKYATGTSPGPFTVEVVDAAGGFTGWDSSIAVDSLGTVHISYYDFFDFDLKYASGTAGAFAVVTLDDGGINNDDVGQYTSLALDSGGFVHISYYDFSNAALKYANNTTGSFETSFVVEGDGVTSDPGLYSSIAVDSGDHVHISYHDAVAGTANHVNSVKNRKSDFNANGKSDIFWQYLGDASVVLWLMNGSSIATDGLVATVGDLSWAIAGNADFDGDNDADILWRHGPTGQIYLWAMNGTAIASATLVATLPDPAWTIEKVADFTGDNRADILWRHGPTGQIYLWTMNGHAITAADLVATVPDPNWVIDKVGDFTGDNRADILWRHGPTGQIYLWTMNGPVITASDLVTTLPDPNWVIEKTGDFNADGRGDILWRHGPSGQVWLWTMNGPVLTSAALVATVPDPDWIIAEVADLDADNKADIFWRHGPSGQLYLWRMNGPSVTAADLVATVPDPNWVIRN